MGLGGVFERVNVVDLDLNLLGDDKVKELGRILFQVGSLRDVAIDNGSHQLDVFGAQLQDVDGGHGSRLKKGIFISIGCLSHLLCTCFIILCFSIIGGHNLPRCRMR